MTGRVFRSPVYGFSIIKTMGDRYSMISSVRCTSASASSRFLGVLAVVLAILYWVHGGLA
jgi:hypothetical protein